MHVYVPQYVENEGCQVHSNLGCRYHKTTKAIKTANLNCNIHSRACSNNRPECKQLNNKMFVQFI
jgi:hypothetical protein